MNIYPGDDYSEDALVEQPVIHCSRISSGKRPPVFDETFLPGGGLIGKRRLRKK